MADDSPPETLHGMVDALRDEVGGKSTDLGSLLDAFEHRLFGSFLLVPALLALAPTGAIPGIPSLLALLIFSIGIQLAVGMSRPWVPSKVLKIDVPSEKIDQGLDRAEAVADNLESWVWPRWHMFHRPPAQQIVGLVACTLAAVMVPLEAVPFSVMIPGFGLILLGVGLVIRDGVLICLGAAVGATAVWVMVRFAL